MAVIRLSSEQKEGKEQQNNKRKDKEVHAYCDWLLQHMLMAAPFTMHTATLAKYVTKHVVFIHEPVMVP
jgi:hypothetical protein